MKRCYAWWLAGLCLATPAVAAAAEPATGCAAKRQSLLNQLADAKAQHHGAQQRGLEKALKENTEHCTDAGLRAEREAKVRAAEKKLNARQQELAAEKDPEDIPKRQGKLKNAERELANAKAELNR
ncbi:DUF1090 domain-containing protein [Pseudomonas typographi]|uniref:DUF1090 domain-containing protein n=1 Tax=Pseudomonas typographi TaxID=2715964 RepID=A0ABR7YVV5_9PSED|nr:DUF1090 domain-containing protein [Pseudomonas typographi]MBD1549906.1 DUF1090 domain-containing protein [Pseudomonas typographi]MBD1585287.1 DUF1090 domain-containing protein [Pseudomonas typographi]MBD1597334.1 DUF1090 domain-containing protein [Pseudomonas typographi]